MVLNGHKNPCVMFKVQQQIKKEGHTLQCKGNGS